MEALLYFLAGVIGTIIVSHLYYRRASKEKPEWAKELIENLPADPPTLSQLLRLFQRHLDSGDVEIHPAIGRIACPECGEPSRNFENKVFGDDAHTIVVATCPNCGWSEHAEV